MGKVPPRDKQGMRTGFTTGACAAAAARAAARSLVRGVALDRIETILPNRQIVSFGLERWERSGPGVLCSVIKDAGDDPDCTHGAELVAEVELTAGGDIELRGGTGVATVTLPGLGLEVGQPAINPVPRRNITEMVRAELAGTQHRGAVVNISVPGGEEMATKTTNARLGLLGGISILGTSGIVRPYSTAAFKASVVQAIEVAAARGRRELVFTTGGKSEAYARVLLPQVPDDALIQVGDFIGVAVKHGARRGMERAHVVGMIGKLSKMADGRMQTHVAGSAVNLGLLAGLAAEVGASPALCAEIAAATTARRVLELCAAEGLVAVTDRICERVVERTERHGGGALRVHAWLVDFHGALLGRYPAAAAGGQA